MARSGRRQYAKGRHALAECQRSGQKMRYRDLVEDGHVPGLLVHPDWWEPKHPQEIPVSVDDPVALWRPSPEISKPPGEGDDPRTGCCNLDPSIPENTTTAGAVPTGATQVGINDALRFDDARGKEGFVYIQMDNGDWYCSPIVVPIQCTPTYTINLAYPFDGPSPISAGAKVVAGNDSNFVLAAAAVPSSLSESASADSTSSAIQINAVGGCPPYLYQWEWVTQPDPLITITSPTSDNSTLTIGSLADGSYQGELLVTITDTASTPQSTTVNIPVTITLASIAQIILGAPDIAGGQTLLTSDDDLTTLVNESLDSPSGDNWDNVLVMSAGSTILTMSDEQEGWYSPDDGATWEEIIAHNNTLLGLANGGGNSTFEKSITYGSGAPLDVTALIRTSDVLAEVIEDAIGNKTLTSVGPSAPSYSEGVATDFGIGGSISLSGSGTSYLRAYNAADGLFDMKEWTIEFSYKPSANDLAADSTTERVILHSDLPWGTAGSWYVYVQAPFSSDLTYGIVVHNGTSIEGAAALGASTANRLDSPNGWQHIAISRAQKEGSTNIRLRHGALSAATLTTTQQIDSNFRIGSDGSGSTAGRNDDNLAYADGNIDEIRITEHFARVTYGNGGQIGTAVQRLYQKKRWPTTGEDVMIYNRTDAGGRGSFISAHSDPRLHQHGSFLLVQNSPGTYLYGMALHKGEMFGWLGDVDNAGAQTNRAMEIIKWDTNTRLVPWENSDLTTVVDLTTKVPAGWSGSYPYTPVNTLGGHATWIASDGTNLYAAIFNTINRDATIVISTDDGSTWNTNTNEISWGSTLDQPVQFFVDSGGYGYFVSFGGIWKTSGPLTSDPTWSYLNVRSVYLSNRGNVKHGGIINGKLYIVGQSNFSPAQGMVGVSTDKGATFTINTNTEFAALTGVTDLFTLGQNP